MSRSNAQAPCFSRGEKVNAEHQVKVSLTQEFENWLWGSDSQVAARVIEQLREQGLLLPDLPPAAGKSAQGRPIWKVDGDFAVVVQALHRKIGVRVGKNSRYVEMTHEQAYMILAALAAALLTKEQ